MLQIGIKDVRGATECDRCNDRGFIGCKIGTTNTEVLACRIEHTKQRNKAPETVGDKIKYIADYYGMVSQSKIAIEEMSELTKALCKLDRYQAMDSRNEKYFDDVIEEIADVWIMMEQLKYLYGVDEVNKQVFYKIDRTIDGIEKEKAKKGIKNIP